VGLRSVGRDTSMLWPSCREHEHWGAIAAADFFTVEVLTRVGLIGFRVFFVIEPKSRRVRIGGIAPEPSGDG